MSPLVTAKPRGGRALSGSGIPDASRRRGFFLHLPTRCRRDRGGQEVHLLRWSPLLAALTGCAYGYGAYRGFTEVGVAAFVALVAVSAVVITVGGETLARALEHGIGTPERKRFAWHAMLVAFVPPVAVWVAVTYLALYDQPWPFAFSPMQRGILFGLVAAALGWTVVAAAITPALGLGARKRPSTRFAPGPSDTSPGVVAPWPNVFVAPDDDPYANDAFEREQDVQRFCRLLASGASPAIWALTGSWGSGKSAFARMAAAECRRDPDIARTIEVNAARARVTGSALLDLVAPIAHGLTSPNASDPSMGTSRLVDLAGAASELRRLSAELIAGADPAGTLDELVTEVREQVTATGGRVVLFVDDLDRCPPDYVLEMLHTVRTVTGCPGLVTVLVLNRDAVEQAVRHHQGVGDSSEEYLRRFIDVAVDLPPPGREQGEEWELRHQWVARMAERLGMWDLLADDGVAKSTLLGIAWQRGVSLRDLEQIVYRTAVCFGELGDPPEPSEEAPGTAGPLDTWHETARAFLGLIVLNLRGESAKAEALATVRSSKSLRNSEIFGSHDPTQGVLRGPPHLARAPAVAEALREAWGRYGDESLDLEALDALATQVAPPLVAVRGGDQRDPGGDR